MRMAPQNMTILTPAQLARFNMPYQDVLKQQWNQIPEIVEKTTSATTITNPLGNMISEAGTFFQDMSSVVADSFFSFGLGIKDTITMLVFLLIALVFFYFCLRLLILHRKTKK